MIFRRDPLCDPAPLIRRVYAYVAYRIGPGPEAEDVTSDTFERALRYRDSYDPARGDPVAWLIGIARRRIVESKRVAAEAGTGGAVTEHEGHEAAVVQRIELADALARLSRKERDLLGLRYVADLSAREIGELLGMSAGAVDVALHRARAHLRGALNDHAASDVAPPPQSAEAA